MTLGTIILIVGAAALVLTLLFGLLWKRVDNYIISFLQNFTGVLFIFSGFVKAVDPLGTAYKMEQYFAEFESTFAESGLSFLVPVFPWLSGFATGFSVFMVVFEIVLGIMLVIGAQRKLTAWLFFLLVAFFTVLTGFTYLTGYVPSGVNFFNFSEWGPYVETNMKVTDCGCFGDFIKLEPKTSFLKDIVLLVPAIIFLFGWGKMHQLFSSFLRDGIVLVSTLALSIYSLSNYMWDIPHADFRPFKEGVNILDRKQAEEEAEANVEIIAYRMTNKSTNQVVELPYQQYLKEYQNYPKEEWKLEQIKTEPTVPHTKISEFAASNTRGEEVGDELLATPGYAFMIIAYDLHQEGPESEPTFEAYYLSRWKDKLNPVMTEAQAAGVSIFAITSYVDANVIKAFQQQSETDYPIYTADDILLKTIVRSNPGIVLMKDGTILEKWHYRKLPPFEKIESRHISELLGSKE